MLLDSILNMFSDDMAIDLGTANTLVLVKGKGVVINEPSIIVIQDEGPRKGDIVAIGHAAKEMMGKTHGSIRIIRPMKDGVIADDEMTSIMIRYFIKQANQINKKLPLMRPRVMVCVPYGCTGVERKSVRDAVLSAGARSVHLIPEPMAAAMGAGLNIDEPRGNLVVDIGGGTTEIGVLSLGGIVVSKSIEIAGDKLDLAIVDFVRKKFNLLIGERTGEEVKIAIGSAYPMDNPLSMKVRGRDQVSGLPNTVELTSEDVREGIKDQLREISNALKSVLENMAPDLSGDIVDNGIILTGGGALIRGLDKYLSEMVNLPVWVADEPLLCVAKGTSVALDNIDKLKEQRVLY